MEEDWWRKGVAELIGAFGLVVGGAGSVLAATAAGQPVVLFAAFGHAFTIAVMGTALAPISGGQISPAVTLGLIVTRHQRADTGVVIIAFQLLGSLLGGFVLRWLYPGEITSPLHLATPAVATAITPAGAMLLELLMTFLVVFVVFATAIDSRGMGKTLGAIPIGLTVCEDIWQPGPPATSEALAGAQVIANISASPYHAGKGHEREQMLAQRARDNVAAVVFCNEIGRAHV